MKDMTNKQIGNLIVKERDMTKPKGAGKPIYWLCDCLLCGSKNNSIDGRKLRGKNPQQSCGCLMGQKNSIDWTNKRQGKLLITEDTGKRTKDRHKIWNYVCDCGNQGEISSSSLTAGIQSCGCLSREKTSERNSTNLIGVKSGKLTVIEKTNQRNYKGNIIWKCICECGNECFASTPQIQEKTKKSCGCLKNSYYEEVISKLLLENNIPFEKEKIFNDCKNIFPLRFDFYVDNKYIIEYDGEQHFKSINSWGGDEGLLKRQQRDNIKNEYCINKNIPLIRIPYTIEEITLEDILLDTSKYLVKGE